MCDGDANLLMSSSARGVVATIRQFSLTANGAATQVDRLFAIAKLAPNTGFGCHPASFREPRLSWGDGDENITAYAGLCISSLRCAQVSRRCRAHAAQIRHPRQP